MLSFLLKLRTRAQDLFRLSDAHTMLVWSVVVGVAGAFATIAFRQAISLLQLGFVGHSGSFVEMARSLPWTTRIWLPAAGGLAAGFLLPGSPSAGEPFPQPWGQSPGGER